MRTNQTRKDAANDEMIDQQHFQGPSTTISHPQHHLADLSSNTSSGEPPSSSHTIDPWFLYSGNIAAACQATNAVVEVHHQTRDEEKAVEDNDKRRQRANSRLTAWQSRERKRIEFEVLQEREAELKNRNLELEQENEQLKLIIGNVRSGTIPRSDDIAIFQQHNELALLNMQSRLMQQRPSSLPSSQQAPSRSLDNLQPHYFLPSHNRQSLSTETSIVTSSANRSYSDIIPGLTPRLSRPGGDTTDLRFANMEPDPLRRANSLSSMQYSTNRERGGRFFSAPYIADDGASRIAGISQQGMADTNAISAVGMNSGVGNIGGGFLFASNDMLAPTIFAPLFRGESSQEQPQSTAINYGGADSGSERSNRPPMFGSTLPFLSSFNGQGTTSTNFSANLSNYLNSASLAEEKVDVPLFRTIKTSTGSLQDGSQQPEQKRQRFTPEIKGQEGGDVGPSRNEHASFDRQRKSYRPQVSTPRGNEFQTNNDEYLLLQQTMTTSRSEGTEGKLASSFSSTNLQHDANDKL